MKMTLEFSKNNLRNQNKKLNAYGFLNPVRIKKFEKDFLISQENLKFSREENEKMSEEYKQATSGEVIKLAEGESIEGKYIGFEESATFKNSYALKVDTRDGIKVIFVSSIVTDLIISNNIVKGQEVKLEFVGMIENKAKTFSYKDYNLFFK